MKNTYTPEFLQLAKVFSNHHKKLPASTYKSVSGGYTIIYLDRLKDKLSGKELRTVARVGHSSGHIELDKTLLEEYNSKHFCYFLILWCGAEFKVHRHQAADTIALKQYLKEKRPVRGATG